MSRRLEPSTVQWARLSVLSTVSTLGYFQIYVSRTSARPSAPPQGVVLRMICSEVAEDPNHVCHRGRVKLKTSLPASRPSCHLNLYRPKQAQEPIMHWLIGRWAWGYWRVGVGWHSGPRAPRRLGSNAKPKMSRVCRCRSGDLGRAVTPWGDILERGLIRGNRQWSVTPKGHISHIECFVFVVYNASVVPRLAAEVRHRSPSISILSSIIIFLFLFEDSAVQT